MGLVGLEPTRPEAAVFKTAVYAIPPQPHRTAKSLPCLAKIVNANVTVYNQKMDNSKKQLGQMGERLAREYLERLGCHFIEANWRCKQGEIDLVMRDGDMLVFVEVKTRRSQTTETGFESITPAKRRRLIRAAYVYVEAHTLGDAQWRIDVVAVALPYGGKATIDHARDALNW